MDLQEQQITTADLAAGLRALDAQQPAAEQPAEKTTSADKQPAEKPANDTKDVNPKVSEEPDAASEASEEPEASEDDAASEASEEPEAGEDPELTKRLEAIAKHEKRSKEAIQAELRAAKAELAEERRRLEAEWRPKVEAAQRFEQLSKRARVDPVGALMALGLSADDFEVVARLVYASSTAGQADPRLRAQATDELRRRQVEDEATQTRRELDELKLQMASERAAAESARQVDAYVNRATKAVTAERSPLVARVLGTNPDLCRARLVEVAERLLARTGEVPEVEDVVAELERVERQELADRGIDPNSLLSKQPKPTTKTKTLTENARTKTAPKTPPMSPHEENADIARALRSGQLD